MAWSAQLGRTDRRKCGLVCAAAWSHEGKVRTNSRLGVADRRSRCQRDRIPRRGGGRPAGGDRPPHADEDQVTAGRDSQARRNPVGEGPFRRRGYPPVKVSSG